MTATRRIGLLGGTFDPPTTAHLAVADLAIDRFGFDQVALIPAADPWQKSPAASAADRLAMCMLAVANHPRLRVSDVELLQTGPTYTVETLRALTLANPDVVFSFLIGEDVDTSTWRDEAECRRLAQFVRIARPDVATRRRHDAVDLESPGGSSTEVRVALAAGEPSPLLPSLVARYIERSGLYRAVAA